MHRPLAVLVLAVISSGCIGTHLPVALVDVAFYGAEGDVLRGPGAHCEEVWLEPHRVAYQDGSVQDPSKGLIIVRGAVGSEDWVGPLPYRFDPLNDGNGPELSHADGWWFDGERIRSSGTFTYAAEDGTWSMRFTLEGAMRRVAEVDRVQGCM